MALSTAGYLVASDSLLMLIVLPEHVTQPSPGRRIAVVNPESFAVALLCCLPPDLALRPPQIPQIVVHVNLPIIQFVTAAGMMMADTEGWQVRCINGTSLLCTSTCSAHDCEHVCLFKLRLSIVSRLWLVALYRYSSRKSSLGNTMTCALHACN